MSKGLRLSVAIRQKTDWVDITSSDKPVHEAAFEGSFSAFDTPRGPAQAVLCRLTTHRRFRRPKRDVFYLVRHAGSVSVEPFRSTVPLASVIADVISRKSINEPG